VPTRPDDGPGLFLRVAGRTDVGLVREHNEDNYVVADLATGSRDAAAIRAVTPSGVLLGVCDGMGGAAAGEVASQMAVDTVLEVLRGSVPAADRDALARALVLAIEEAGARIFEAARADRSRRGMGTTATIATLMDHTLFVGQVGDSRAYILRGRELKQITKDQSLVNQLIEAGQLTEDEAEAFEHSNIILQALGTTAQVTVDLTFLELRRGDRLLLCSDGLSGLIHGDLIRDTMLEYTDLEACCERLIALARDAGGHDNITAILADFRGQGLPAQGEDIFGYQQYPLPPEDGERDDAAHDDRGSAVTPPVPRPSLIRGLSERPRQASARPRRRSSSLRTWVVLLVLGAVAGVLVGLLTRKLNEEPEQVEAQPEPEPALREVKQPGPVEVVVRTDVPAGELVIDGELRGVATSGRWVLALGAGLHRLEARALGQVVTSQVVNVVEGEPLTVFLSMPAGESLGDSADAGEGRASDAKRDKRPKKRAPGP
jgi:PPM family protein phosphatase